MVNVSYSKKEEIYSAYLSKHNLNREEQVTFLIILNRKKCHYLALQKPSALLRTIT